MRQSLVIGIGQLGSLFADGLARAGWVVEKAGRNWDGNIPASGPIWVCVGEEALHAVVVRIPAAERERVIVCQNELFPSTLLALGLERATCLVVWFNRKLGGVPKLGPTDLVFGPEAKTVHEVYRALSIPLRSLKSREELALALAVKYAFILGINALGTQSIPGKPEGYNATVGEWRNEGGATTSEAVRVLAWAFELSLKACGLNEISDAARSALLADLDHALTLHSDLPTRGRKSLERLNRARALESSLRHSSAEK